MLNGEYLTSNTAIAYPFKDGQNVPEWLLRLFVDASILSLGYDVKLTGASYSLLTGQLSFTVNGYTYKTPVVRYSTSPYVKIGYDNSFFMIDMQYLDTLPDCSFSGELLFEPSCVFVDADSVTSFWIYDGEDGTGVPSAVVSGDVNFLCGYNMVLSEGDDDGSLALEAKPGAGLGIVPCSEECEEDPNTNGHPLPTDDGHAVIAGDGCYEVTSKGDTIQLHGKCVACCQCQAYVDIVEDLKEIAEEVKKEKELITTTQTNKYFDLLDKFAVDGGKLEMDVQVDISPDASISEAAYRGSKDYLSNGNLNYFRVNCTVTNLCGVPCAVTVPDLWSSTEYGTSGILYISGRDYTGGYVKEPGKLICNGIQAIVAGAYTTKGDSEIPAASSSYTIDPTAAPDSEGGWLVYSRIRGPRIRHLNDRDKRTYQDIGLTSESGWLSRNNVEDAWSSLSSDALSDLNSGRNPSQLLQYAEAMTDYYAKGGFIMPAGYSFTITNVYAVPVSDTTNKIGLSAIFRGYAYAPLLMYSRAYNQARPETSMSTTSDGYVFTTKWSLKDSYVGVDGVKRPVWGGCSYRYDNNKTYNLNEV